MNSFNSLSSRLNNNKIKSLILKISDYAIIGTLSGVPLQNKSITYPFGMCIDQSDNLYFCDRTAAKVSRINTSTNTFDTLLSGAAYNNICIDTNNMLYIVSSNVALSKYNTNGVSQGAPMDIPNIQVVAVDSAFNIYVSAEYSGYIKKYTSFGGTATNYIGGGSITLGSIVDGTTTISEVILNASLTGLYIKNNKMYIVLSNGFVAYADLLTGKMYKYASGLSTPYGMVIDNNGVGYICEYGQSRVQKITTPGTKVVFAGGGTLTSGLDLNLTSASILPLGIVISKNNIMYITDNANRSIRIIFPPPSLISDYAITGTLTDVPFQNKTIINPNSMCIDASDNLYFVNTLTGIVKIDTINNNFSSIITDISSQLMNIDKNNMIYVTGQSQVSKYNTNGVKQGSTWSLSAAFGIAVDNNLNIYIGTIGAGGFITIYTTFGGTGVNLIGGGTISLPSLAADGSTPLLSVKLDTVFNLYIKNNILYITDATSIAYYDISGGKIYPLPFEHRNSSGNGIAIDNKGDLYICSYSLQYMFKISPGISSGVKTLFAGIGTALGPTSGLNINLNNSSIRPAGIAIASNGIMYITDYANNSIRKIIYK